MSEQPPQGETPPDASDPASGPQSPASGPRSPASGPRSPASGPQSPTSGPQSSASGPQSPASGPQSSYPPVAPPVAQQPVGVAPYPIAPRPCSSCGREVGSSAACQHCRQVQGLPEGVRLSSVGKRFGEYCLETVLALVTLFIGWAIWSLVVYGRGQTPAKQVLKMKIVKLDTRKPTGWGMTWVREWPCKFVISLAALFTFYIVYFWPLWDKENQELWDKMVNTVVVDDDQDLLNPERWTGPPATGALPRGGPEVPAPLS